MGLTRLAQDPWSESHTVPTFTPLPVEVKSSHVPLTAERAEELVKCHLERTGVNLRRSHDQPDYMEPEVDAGVCGSGPPATTQEASNILRFGYHTPSLIPYSSASAKRLMALSRPRPATSPVTPAVLGDADGDTDGTDPGGPGPAGIGDTGPATAALDAVLMQAWMREAEAMTAEAAAFEGEAAQAGRGEPTYDRAAGVNDNDAVIGGAAGRNQSRRPTSGQTTLSRRISCPENLLNLQGGGEGTEGSAEDAEVLEPGEVTEQEDALEPLANHHMWMYGRGRMDGGGMGLLYSAAAVLEADGRGGGGGSSNSRVIGGWQPRDAASIFEMGPWDAGFGSGPFGSGGNGSGGGHAEKSRPTTQITTLIHEGAGTEVIRTLAAVIIQSYCRGWAARRRVARMQSFQRSEESRRLKERAAAEALARERESVRRRLRAAAKDCLLAVQAQQDYERTRARLAAARGLSGGAAAAAPPPPPTIPTTLWERCKALGQDPIEILLESGLQSHQIEEIISASQLASQLPRRAAMMAARLGVPLAPVPEGSRPASSGRASSYAGAPPSAKVGSASDDNGASAAAAAGAGVAGARGSMMLSRRLSLPGRPLLPSQRSMTAAAAAPPRPPLASTSQLVEQLLAQQQQQSHLQMQQQQHQYGRPASGSPVAVRRSSGPGVLIGAGAAATATSMPAPPSQLRRHGSPARALANSDSGAGQRLGNYPVVYGSGGGAVLGPLGATRSSMPAPLVRGNSRRMSDYVGNASGGGGGGGGNSGGGAVYGLAGAATAPPPGPVRTRSLGMSDSGAAIFSLSAGQPMMPPPLPPSQSGRVVLPAVPQQQAVSAIAGVPDVSPAGGGVLACSESGDMNGNGGAGVGVIGSGGGFMVAAPPPHGGLSLLGTSASTPAPSSLTQQQQQPQPQQTQAQQYLPYHLQQQMVASSCSSPVNRSSPQVSASGPIEAHPGLVRRHSFVEHLAGGDGGSGTNSSPNSFSTGGAAITDSGSPASSGALTRGAHVAAAAAVALRGNLTTTVGGGGGGGGFPAYLPPLLSSQGSGSAGMSSGGGSSRTSSPSAAVAVAAGSGASHVDLTSHSRPTRKGSNLAPTGTSLAVAAMTAGAVVASPPLAPPPTTASPKSFRRLQSLTHANASAAAAAAAGLGNASATGSPPPSVSRVLSYGGPGSATAAVATAAAAAAAAVAATSPGDNNAAPRAPWPLPAAARPPAATSSPPPSSKRLSRLG
ncbi:hypothetical protein Vafri_9253 [Volvox africanus]|uniref:Uncharacterized protein n=1 Tax=Volvox africanus TaxID=51714 RepID=A0A8J4B407_9CHLO|nr:hypothetical protein Vafri_9253 [Volvox africanus]